jgi:hypothetical protein
MSQEGQIGARNAELIIVVLHYKISSRPVAVTRAYTTPPSLLQKRFSPIFTLIHVYTAELAPQTPADPTDSAMAANTSYQSQQPHALPAADSDMTVAGTGEAEHVAARAPQQVVAICQRVSGNRHSTLESPALCYSD